MIELTEGQQVPATEYLVKAGGMYNDEDLVICEFNNIEVAFQAYYIVNGKCVGE